MTTYTIKPLDWKLNDHHPDDGDSERWSVSTIFGSINVDREEGDYFQWRHCFDEYYDEGQESCDSIEDGKEKAEAFYLGRLMPALAEATTQTKEAT